MACLPRLPSLPFHSGTPKNQDPLGRGKNQNQNTTRKKKKSRFTWDTDFAFESERPPLIKIRIYAVSGKLPGTPFLWAKEFPGAISYLGLGSTKFSRGSLSLSLNFFSFFLAHKIAGGRTMPLLLLIGKTLSKTERATKH